MAELNRRLLIALAAGAALFAGRASAADLSEQKTLGNPKAPVEMVEYASASCPHCARFALDVFPAFKKKYVDTGKVHFVFREVLTPPAEIAAAGFMIARCAPAGRYFQTLDKVFESQKQWKEGVDLRAIFVGIAQSEGMTDKQMEACVSDPAAQKAINDRVEKFTTLDKVDSTPTFFINGKRLEGEHTLADLDKAIAAAKPRPVAAPARKPAAHARRH